MINEKKRILAKIANPGEREERLQLYLSLPHEKPNKKPSSRAAVALWVGTEEEKRA
jgi:hypothetical protein